MIASATASNDDHVHEKEFVCLYLDDVVRKLNWKMLTIKYHTTSGNQQGSGMRLN